MPSGSLFLLCRYPLAFILNMPPTTNTESKVMYSRALPTLTAMFGVNKHITLEDADDFDDEWLAAQLKI